MAIASVVLVGTIVMSAVAAVPAFADGTTPTPTSMTLTSNHLALVTGKSVMITATVTPDKIGTEKITGPVDFTITGSGGSTVPCTSVSVLSARGTAKCKIARGVLLAGTYNVVASYGGSTDAVFGPSSNSVSISVASTLTNIHLALNAPPTPGSPTTVTATVVAGQGTPLLSGNVVFLISSEHSGGVFASCDGLKSGADNVQPITGQTATCTLPAGWVVLPKLTISTPKPRSAWSVSAVYNGNASFSTSFKTKKGVIR